MDCLGGQGPEGLKGRYRRRRAALPFPVPGQALAGGLDPSSVVKILVMIWSVWVVLVP